MRLKRFLHIIILVVICSITIGFSAFGSENAISKIVAEVRIQKDIRVTNFMYSSNGGSGISSYEDYSVNSLLTNVSLPNEDSTITYKVTVTNFGNVEMGIYELTGLPSNLTYEVSGYSLQDKLCDNNEKCSLGAVVDFYVTIKYSTSGFNSLNTSYNLNIGVDFREIHTISYEGITNNSYPSYIIDGGNLSIVFTKDIPPKVVAFNNGTRVDYNLYSYENNVFTYNNVLSDLTLKYQEKAYLTVLSADTYFKESSYKTVIDSVQFVEYVDTSNAVKTYDLSEGQDDSIIGWITAENDLYIGSEWKIYGKNLGYAFYQMSGVESITFDNLNTSESTDMRYMFYDCNKLTSLDVSSFVTKNVTNMKHMFEYLSNIKTLDVTNFDTSKVTEFAYMFRGMSDITELNLSNFDTSSATRMDAMFWEMSSVTELNVSNFDTSLVYRMDNMFRDCKELKSLELSNFNTEQVTDMGYMFSGISGITELKLSGFNTSRVRSMAGMFSGNSSLKILDISDFDTSKVENFYGMFSGVYKLEKLDLSHFDTSSATNMSFMFNYSRLKELDVSNFDTSNVTSMRNMFPGLRVSELDLSSFDTSKVTDMHEMFREMYNLVELDLSSFDTSNVTDMSEMFMNCYVLTELKLNNFTFDKVTNSTDMFSNLPNKINVTTKNTDTKLWLESVLGESAGTVTIA